MSRKIFLLLSLFVFSFSQVSLAAHHHGEPIPTEQCYSKSKVDFINAMRKLWEDHITWTRGYLVAAVANNPDALPVLGRLLKNQKDIGDAIVPYYGAEAGKKLTELLTEHIVIAGKIVGDLLASNDPQANIAAWYANGDDIATFLSGANPNWPLADMKAMMKDHLDTTTAEVLAHVKHDWAGSIEAYDKAHLMILEMADGLSMGIIAQFPYSFGN
ncbi:MAG: glycosyltransferase [Bacteriovoracales bacterium]